MKTFFKKILKKIRNLIFSIIDSCACHTAPKFNPQSLIIIRTDAIGDYILFRNFLEVLKKFYPNYQITFLGNSIYQDFALHLDGKFIDQFIWFDRNAFLKNPFYRAKFIASVTKITYDYLLDPIYSRDLHTDIFLSKIIRAREKIAPQGDCSNTTLKSKQKADKIFNRLLPNKNEILFEFDRNREFFEHLLKTKIEIKLSINPNDLPSFNFLKQTFKISSPYIVLFIGAGMEFRKWDIKNFSNIACYIIKKYHHHIVLCSGKEDIQNAKIIESGIPNLSKLKIHNLVGKITLLELGAIINYSNMLISNETSAPHLATALNTPCITISNGNHLSRFTPPNFYTNYHLILHPSLKGEIKYHSQTFNQPNYQSKLNINEITPEMLYLIIDNLLKEQ